MSDGANLSVIEEVIDLMKTSSLQNQPTTGSHHHNKSIGAAAWKTRGNVWQLDLD